MPSAPENAKCHPSSKLVLLSLVCQLLTFSSQCKSLPLNHNKNQQKPQHTLPLLFSANLPLVSDSVRYSIFETPAFESDKLSDFELYDEDFLSDDLRSREETSVASSSKKVASTKHIDFAQQVKRRTIDGPNEVLISVKTTAKFHRKRLDLILATWHRMAPNNTLFFTDNVDQDSLYKQRLGDKLVATNCLSTHSRQALACKMSRELLHFVKLQQQRRSQLQQPLSWFCHFDDDNYVNVERLYAKLAQFDPSDKLYLGKTSIRGKLELNASASSNEHLFTNLARPLTCLSNNQNDKDSQEEEQQLSFSFATGGAGFCLSRSLVDSLSESVLSQVFMEVSDKLHFPDDVTVGFLIECLHGTRLQVVPEFHSHLEQLSALQASTLADQISFSYSINAAAATTNAEANVVGVVAQQAPLNAIRDNTKLLTLHCSLQSDDCERAVRAFKALKAQNKLASLRSHSFKLRNNYTQLQTGAAKV